MQEVLEELWEGEVGENRYGGTCDGKNPQGPTGTWAQDESGKGGGAHSQRNGSRHRHDTKGVETSGGDWWVAVAGNVQVGGYLRRERK